ncbi:dehalogenase [Dehalococcoides mccartyi CG1]|nr:dehalogenase [Dehalococcoides mccartyi CG1]
MLGAGLTGLIWWLNSRNISVRWHDWLIGGIGIALVSASYQHTLGELWEGLPSAAFMGLLVIGGLGIIFLLIAFLSVWRRNKMGNSTSQ